MFILYDTVVLNKNTIAFQHPPVDVQISKKNNSWIVTEIYWKTMKEQIFMYI
jgi:hypothetical protein